MHIIPVEIEYLLKNIQQSFKGKKIIVFQPHRYSRTEQFKEDFAKVLRLADKTYLLPTYPASESFKKEGCAEVIWEQSPSFFQCITADNFHQVFSSNLTPKEPTCLLFVGAGRLVDSLARELTRGENFFPKMQRTTS